MQSRRPFWADGFLAGLLPASVRQQATEKYWMRERKLAVEKTYLVLENGEVYEGRRFGATGEISGELVFTTGMGGYLETLTDPAYAGQIVMQTFPLIGIYGAISQDTESGVHPAGYVVRHVCDAPSNFRCEETLDAWMKREGIVGICELDTRELTRVVREHGTMHAMITDTPPADLGKITVPAVPRTGCREAYTVPAAGACRHRIALLDCGVMRSELAALAALGCEVTVLPAETGAAGILQSKPEAVVLSGGPGDPADYTDQIVTVKELFGKVPLFGFGLGHQLMALADGAKTEKMKQGHRGSNQPVREVNGTRTYITAQNHGYTVLPDTLRTGKVSYVNVTDGTCEGVDYPGRCAFSVQFSPALCTESARAGAIFDRLIALMEGGTL